MAQTLDDVLKQAVLSGKMVRRMKLRKQRLFVSKGREVPQVMDDAIQAARNAHSMHIDELAAL